jgi:hypothetical protein
MAKIRAQSPDNPHLELSLARSFRFGREIASVSDAIIRYGWKLAAGGPTRPTHYGAAAARGAGGPRAKPANLVGTLRATIFAPAWALCVIYNQD